MVGRMIRLFAFVMFMGVLFLSCSTVSSKLPGVSISSPVVLQPGSVVGTVDFREGEVLCASGSDAYREDFYTARIVTDPSAATKNQAEVVYVSDGKKEWVNFVFPSRKSTKQELAIGKVVFAPVWHEQQKEITSDDYRKGLWRLGRVTSTDELFKDIVEINGDKYYWQVLRIPDREP